MFSLFQDCDDLDRRTLENEDCRRSMQHLLDTKDLYDCEELKQVCE